MSNYRDIFASDVLRKKEDEPVGAENDDRLKAFVIKLSNIKTVTRKEFQMKLRRRENK